MNSDELLKFSLDLGEQMLVSGAEISRVEDTLQRIAHVFGCKSADVFVITSVIFLTLTDSEDRSVTGTRRVSRYDTNLDKLHKYNDLSRYICANVPEIDEIRERFEEVKQEKGYSLPLQVFACAMISASFTLFFGGSAIDAAASAVAGAVLKLIVCAQSKTKVNMVFSNVISSAAVCLLAFSFVRLGFGEDSSKIIVGNIMLLIPGVALTNSIRDMISGDIISGMLRLFEALIIAFAIAAGYILVALMFGGVTL